MKLTPLADRVILKMVETEETTKGGIILTGSAKEKPSVAEVISVGPGGMVDGKEVTMTVKPGDKVITSQYAGQGDPGGRGVRSCPSERYPGHRRVTRHKLHIPRFGLAAKALSFRCSSFFRHKRFAGLRRKGTKERWGMCPDKMLELIFAATCAWQKFLDPSRPRRRRQFTNWRGGIYCAAVSSFAALRMRRALYGQRGDAVPHFKKTWRL